MQCKSSATAPAVAGEAETCWVFARDGHGNPSTSALTSGFEALFTVGNSVLPATVAPYSGSTGGVSHQVSFTPTAAGEGALTVTYDGAALRTAAAVPVLAGSVSAAKTTVRCPTNSTQFAPVQCMVTARDAFDNSAVGASTTDLMGVVTGAAFVVSSVSTTASSGTFLLKFTPSLAGSYSVGMRVKGTSLAAGSSSETVAHTKIDATRTQLQCEDSGKAGETTSCSVYTFDSAGSPEGADYKDENDLQWCVQTVHSELWQHRQLHCWPHAVGCLT